MSNEKIKGSCLCGDVTYHFSGPAKVFQYCHCTRCQKITGSAHASNIIIDPENFEWLTGETQVGRYEVPDAKYFAVSFCRKCGSNLPWKTQGGTAHIIPAGTLDDDPKERPVHNIYYADKACWYEDMNALVKYDALPSRK